MNYLVDMWRPDLARFKREVAEAISRGAGDELALAEMECTLDLIEADLLAMRADRLSGSRTSDCLARAEAFRSELVAMIAELRPLCSSD